VWEIPHKKERLTIILQSFKDNADPPREIIALGLDQEAFFSIVISNGLDKKQNQVEVRIINN